MKHHKVRNRKCDYLQFFVTLWMQKCYEGGIFAFEAVGTTALNLFYIGEEEKCNERLFIQNGVCIVHMHQLMRVREES